MNFFRSMYRLSLISYFFFGLVNFIKIAPVESKGASSFCDHFSHFGQVWFFTTIICLSNIQRHLFSDISITKSIDFKIYFHIKNYWAQYRAIHPGKTTVAIIFWVEIFDMRSIMWYKCSYAHHWNVMIWNVRRTRELNWNLLVEIRHFAPQKYKIDYIQMHI